MEKPIQDLFDSVKPFLPAIRQAYTLYQVNTTSPQLTSNQTEIDQQQEYIDQTRKKLGLSSTNSSALMSTSDASSSTSPSSSSSTSSSLTTSQFQQNTQDFQTLQNEIFNDPMFLQMLASSLPQTAPPVNVSDYINNNEKSIKAQQIMNEPILSFKDQQVFMARMSQLFALFKQLISNYEQERMNWIVFGDQITREIGFLAALLRQDKKSVTPESSTNTDTTPSAVVSGDSL